MWEVQAISSIQRSVHLSARYEIDKADTWFSLGYSPAYNKMLWKRNVQAVMMRRYRP